MTHWIRRVPGFWLTIYTHILFVDDHGLESSLNNEQHQQCIRSLQQRVAPIWCSNSLCRTNRLTWQWRTSRKSSHGWFSQLQTSIESIECGISECYVWRFGSQPRVRGELRRRKTKRSEPEKTITVALSQTGGHFRSPRWISSGYSGISFSLSVYIYNIYNIYLYLCLCLYLSIYNNIYMCIYIYAHVHT